MAKAISKTQVSGMRVVSGAFRATLIRELEAETYIPPMDIYCAKRQARHIRKVFASLTGAYIQEQCRIIYSQLR